MSKSKPNMSTIYQDGYAAIIHTNLYNTTLFHYGNGNWLKLVVCYRDIETNPLSPTQEIMEKLHEAIKQLFVHIARSMAQ